MAAPPLFTHACHCRNCQRDSNSAFRITVIILEQDFSINKGQIVETLIDGRYRIVSCSSCHDVIYKTSTSHSATGLLTAGTLDELEQLPINAHIWAKRKHPGISIPGSIPTFSEQYDRDSTWPSASLKRLRTAQKGGASTQEVKKIPKRDHQYELNIVCGAPGTGKSTTVAACLDSSVDFTVLDIDWLLESTNSLLSAYQKTTQETGQQTDIRFASILWPPYNALWFEVMHSLFRNGKQPVLFAPITPKDIDSLPPWCRCINWLFLDCPESELGRRLKQRGWLSAEIDDALKDAEMIRQISAIEPNAKNLDTHKLTTFQVVKTISDWATKNR